MTDREKLLALLADFGLEHVSSDTYGGPLTPGEVRLESYNGNIGGYRGFYTSFLFDADGKFESCSVWE